MLPIDRDAFLSDSQLKMKDPNLNEIDEESEFLEILKKFYQHTSLKEMLNFTRYSQLDSEPLQFLVIYLEKKLAGRKKNRDLIESYQQNLSLESLILKIDKIKRRKEEDYKYIFNKVLKVMT